MRPIMRLGWSYANVSFWPIADIGTESKSLLVNDRFGEKSGRSDFEIAALIAL